MKSKTAVRACWIVGSVIRLRLSIFRVAKKLSATALSKQFPVLLMLQSAPMSRRACLKAPLVYWVDSTGRRNSQGNQELE